MADVLEQIDELLTYYSAGLGEEITVDCQTYPGFPGIRIDDVIDQATFAAHMLALVPPTCLVPLAEVEGPPATFRVWLDRYDEAIERFEARLRRMHHLYRLRRRRW